MSERHDEFEDEAVELHPVSFLTENSPVQWSTDYRPDVQHIVTDTHNFSLDQPVIDNTEEGKAEAAAKAAEEAEKLEKAKSGIDANSTVQKNQPEET